MHWIRILEKPNPIGAFVVGVLAGIAAPLWKGLLDFIFGGRLKEKQARLDYELKKKQSRLEYENEARKRLYSEFEPLIFELLETAAEALARIRSLAWAARDGDLPQWLSMSRNQYYCASTMYYLLAPVAVYKLMRRRLTVIDMNMDQNIARRYQIAKQLATSFSHPFDFARRLDYEPHNEDWKTLRIEDQAKYWQQGVSSGRVDAAAESLIVRDHEPDGALRIRSIGDFESEFVKPGSVVAKAFAIVWDVFNGFHPATRPVLWRMLVTQAHIYGSIIQFHKESGADRNLTVTPMAKEEDRESLYWKKSPSADEQKAMSDAFTVAETYLAENIATLWAGAAYKPGHDTANSASKSSAAKA